MNRLLQSFVSYDQPAPRSNTSQSSGSTREFPGYNNYGPPPSMPVNDDQYETLDLNDDRNTKSHAAYNMHHQQGTYHAQPQPYQQYNPLQSQYNPHGTQTSYIGHQQGQFGSQSYYGPHSGSSNHSSNHYAYQQSPEASPPPTPAVSFFSSNDSMSTQQPIYTDVNLNTTTPASAADLFGAPHTSTDIQTTAHDVSSCEDPNSYADSSPVTDSYPSQSQTNEPSDLFTTPSPFESTPETHVHSAADLFSTQAAPSSDIHLVESVPPHAPPSPPPTHTNIFHVSSSSLATQDNTPTQDPSPPRSKTLSMESLSTTLPIDGPPRSNSKDLTMQLMLQYKQMAERLEVEKNELLDILSAQAEQFHVMQAYIDQLVAEKNQQPK